MRPCRAEALRVAGRRDRLLRGAICDEIRALRPDAEIRVIDAPHLVLQRRPHEAMEIVAEFLARCACHRPACGPRPAGGAREAGLVQYPLFPEPAEP